MGIFDYVELTLGTLLSGVKNHYSKTISHHQILLQFPQPNIDVTSSAYETSSGTEKFTTASGASFPVHEIRKEHTQFGANEAVPISYSPSPSSSLDASKIKEWVVVIQDPDAPLPVPITHGLWYGIPAGKTSIDESDLELAEGVKMADVPVRVKGGFSCGKLIEPHVHVGPRPPYGHGPHLYLYQVLALGETVDWAALEANKPLAVKELCQAVDGKVLGWGMWVGSVEKKWGKM